MKDRHGCRSTIKLIKYGFIETYQNKYIESIIAKYNESIAVNFCNKTKKEFKLQCDSFNSQYGIPISIDGKLLFLTSWDWWEGIRAYNIESGELVWQYKKGRIRNVYTYQKYLVALRANKSIVKLDIETGEVIDETITGNGIESMFMLNESSVLVDRIRGKISVVDVNDMKVTKTYDMRTANPKDCLGFDVTDAVLENNKLVISTLEQYPKSETRDIRDLPIFGNKCKRIIDFNFQE